VAISIVVHAQTPHGDLLSAHSAVYRTIVRIFLILPDLDNADSYEIGPFSATRNPWVNIFTCTASDDGAYDGTWCCAYANDNCCSLPETFIPNFGVWKAASTVTTSTTRLPTTPTGNCISQVAAHACSNNNAVITGATVGSILGLALLASLVLLFRERKKRTVAGLRGTSVPPIDRPGIGDGTREACIDMTQPQPISTAQYGAGSTNIHEIGD
jgi:hypothetical protein